MKAIVFAIYLSTTVCSAATSAQAENTEKGPVWPEGLANTRIAWQEEISSSEGYKSLESMWKRIKGWLGGGGERKMLKPMGLDYSQGLLAVADQGLEVIHIFDRENNTYQRLKLSMKEGRCVPVDVALHNGHAYVACSRSGQIPVINLEDGSLSMLQPSVPLERISGIHITGNRIYLSEPTKHRIVMIDSTGTVLNSLGQRGADSLGFNFPSFITADRKGDLYITDTMNFRISKFSDSLSKRKNIGTAGTQSGQFNRPKGIAVDGEGNLFVVDASFENVQIFSPEGRFLLSFGSSGGGKGEFSLPTDIVIAGNTAFVSDTMNGRVQIFHLVYGQKEH